MALKAAAHFSELLMSYIALARKWRPRTFAQLLGQEHINKALINSLDKQRLHHAYLFTGTRGVGKTSVARLLAKALNCEQSISSTPCLTCDTCLAIEQGRFVDLIEIDGASKTRVEDTRELLENIHYAPTNARFKIYLIDEVHMLSQHSFNALLKTLEEPPSHVKFLLATTDPQKLPVTVLSRCLQFNLRHVQAAVIEQHIQHILDDEKLTYDAEAIALLATAARGSVRDALSLLDQAIASCNNHLSTQEVKNCLGYTQHDYAMQLLEALTDLSAETVLSISQKIAAEGGHFRYVLDEMLSDLHQISICQSLSKTSPQLNMPAELMTLSTRFTQEDTQLFYQIALKGTQDMSLAPSMNIGFEMTLLRMLAFRPAPLVERPTLAYENVNKIESPSLQTQQLDRVSHSEPLDCFATLATTVTETAPLANKPWSEIVSQLKLSGLTLNAAENSEFLNKVGGNVTLSVARGHQSVFTPSVLTRLEDALTHYYNEKIKLTLNSDNVVSASPAIEKEKTQIKQQEDASLALQNDPFFQQLQQEFSAELVKNSISPIKNGL